MTIYIMAKTQLANGKELRTQLFKSVIDMEKLPKKNMTISGGKKHTTSKVRGRDKN